MVAQAERVGRMEVAAKCKAKDAWHEGRHVHAGIDAKGVEAAGKGVYKRG